jgi:hypothetical protein
VFLSGRNHVTAAAAAAAFAAAAALRLCVLVLSRVQLLQQEIIDETDLYVDNMQVRNSAAPAEMWYSALPACSLLLQQQQPC